ncbi:error-prone DNA polymerase [Arenicella sp. 4NH20-0111]|uniref:error-prone DNA polymerase n=1 Tax=Arenicella sp. 4NH20-0111 TaxID=3127648 RepID=UPI0031058F3F
MYSELHTKSHYSFLKGASSPEELVRQAKSLGYQAIALTDECSYSGLVKAHKAAKEADIKLIIGSQFRINVDQSAFHMILLAQNLTAYSEISALITKGRRRSPKGEYFLTSDDLKFGLKHCLAIWLPSSRTHDATHGEILRRYFKHRLWLGVGLFRNHDDQDHYFYHYELSNQLGIKMVACNDVLIHKRDRKPLLDTVTAIRLNTSVQSLGNRTHSNSERYLRSITELQQLYPAELLSETQRISELCNVDMDDLRYQYPKELVPRGIDPSDYLRKLTQDGCKVIWPGGTPKDVTAQIEYELAIIKELEYEYYFLTVHDIVAFARSKGILCQGRGSAANSAVCYCLFITSVDPSKSRLLFERFISKERNEPPDIDVDFESQRREEVIQYIYNKYSRKRTALTATVITYRRKSAVRDVAKALGLPESFANDLNRSLAWWDKVDVLLEQFQNQNFSFNSDLALRFFTLVKEIMGTPRHLSQHVGGFIITELPTSTLVPIENASMPDRTVIQWDKYDIEILGLLKVDVLGLGMLSAIQKSLTMINAYQSDELTMHNLPRENSEVYDMLCQGDSVGVFQVESRAQMSMLPRLKPRRFYDLVIQVAIVRPGPIQGDMVHPYLKRRNKEEPTIYPTPEIKNVLERTLGIPIFQEQVIELTMVAAGFSGGEADELRRAMASWGKNGDLAQFEEKLVSGMLENGHSKEFALRIYQQIQGFGSYGFPESHSASFALLVYVSAWIKRFHPAAFYAGILNSQPMGFYSPSQLIQDARRHQVDILPVCIMQSSWEHTLVNKKTHIAIQLGLRLVKGVSEKSARNIEMSRSKSRILSIEDFKNRQLVHQDELMKLVNANAFSYFDKNRRNAYWNSLQMNDGLNTQRTNSSVRIQPLSKTEELLSDYKHASGVSLKHHPMQLLRSTLPFRQCITADRLLSVRNNSFIQIAGMVTGRQRPGTASGVLFLTLEDETGNINVVVWSGIQERFKQQILRGRILHIKGKLEHQHGVSNVIAGFVEDQSQALPNLNTRSRNFH